MANSIGKAALILGTKNAGLGSGLNNAYSKISGWKNKVAGFFQSGFAGLMGGAFGSSAFDTAKDLANSGDLAASIGMSTGQFMGLKKAAELAGVDVKSLMEGLIDMSGRASEAMKGGQFAEMFKKLGLDPAKVNAMNADAKFWAMADAISSVQNASERAQMTLKVFGEDVGKQLLPIMSRGSAKLREFVEEQKRIGTALSESDMAKLQRLRDAVPKAGAVFEGAWNRLVVAAAPALTSLAERFASVWKGAQPYLNSAVAAMEKVIRIGGAALEELLVWGGKAVQWLSETSNLFGTINGQAVSLSDVVEIVAKGIAYAALITAEYSKTVVAPLVGLWGMLAGNVDATNWAMAQLTGQNAYSNFLAIESFFAKLRETKTEIAKPIDFTPTANSAVAALQSINNAAIMRGSQEDYSFRMKWQFGLESWNQKQLEETKNGNKIAMANGKKLDAIRAAMGGIAGVV